MEIEDLNRGTLEDSFNEDQKRPTFLKVLCILTFISTGTSFFGPVFQLIRGPQTARELTLQKRVMAKAIDDLRDLHQDYIANLYEQLSATAVELNNVHYLYNATLLLMVLLGLGGALLMWHRRKLGFHLYIVYSLFSALGVYLFVSSGSYPVVFAITSLIFSGAFVFMYSRNLSWMK